MNNITKVSEERCTGCGACYNKCPFGAITMQYNSEGFISPVVDEIKCTDCGLCIGSCHALNMPQKNGEPSEAYAIITSDSIRSTSSSGGFFTLIARSVLERGGVVFGAAFCEGYTSVCHVEIRDEDELYRLRGSKYLQSDTKDTYKRAKELLDGGTEVLYSGTPCQIAGLKAYLKRTYKNLLLVDIICHGVPSPKAYEAYVTERANGKPIERMDFREKAHFGWGTAFSLFTEDGAYRSDCFTDPYLKGFLGGMITRRSCTECPYTTVAREGDFTLGDFWGIADALPELDDKRGTSLVMVNTPRARALFDTLEKQTEKCRAVPMARVIEIAKTRNGRLLCPTKRHMFRDRFFEQFRLTGGKSYITAYERATKKYDVGYIGWWDSRNYGSALTSFAMSKTLKALGKSVILLEHPGLTPENVKGSCGAEFARRFTDTTDITWEKNNKRFNDICDTFLVGSDQLWNWWNNKHATGYFFLDFAYKEHKKIAYATSFGMDYTDYPENVRLKVGYYLSRFDAISVREASGVDVCKNEFSIEATHVMDPVFLCDMDSYREVIALSEIKTDEPYLFSYVLDPTEDKIRMVRETARARGIGYRIAIDALGNVNEESKRIIERELDGDPNVMRDLKIEDWLALIAGADYVATDSFHGFCFSLIFGKPSMAYINPRRGKARFDSIAEVLGVEDRLITNYDEACERSLATSGIDYDRVHKIMKERADESREWLRRALEAENRRISVQELLLWKCLEHDEKINGLSGTKNSTEAALAELTERIDKLEGQLKGGFFARLFGKRK